MIVRLPNSDLPIPLGRFLPSGISVTSFSSLITPLRRANKQILDCRSPATPACPDHSRPFAAFAASVRPHFPAASTGASLDSTTGTSQPIICAGVAWGPRQRRTVSPFVPQLARATGPSFTGSPSLLGWCCLDGTRAAQNASVTYYTLHCDGDQSRTQSSVAPFQDPPSHRAFLIPSSTCTASHTHPLHRHLRKHHNSQECGHMQKRGSKHAQ